MKIKKILFIVPLILIMGCTADRGTIIENLDPQEITLELVKEWINSNSGSNGIYLGKIENDNRIFVYINYKHEVDDVKFSVPNVTINSINNHLTIDALPRLSDKVYEEVYIINYKKKIKEVYLNQSEIKFSEIYEIK